MPNSTPQTIPTPSEPRDDTHVLRPRVTAVLSHYCVHFFGEQLGREVLYRILAGESEVAAFQAEELMRAWQELLAMDRHGRGG